MWDETWSRLFWAAYGCEALSRSIATVDLEEGYLRLQLSFVASFHLVTYEKIQYLVISRGMCGLNKLDIYCQNNHNCVLSLFASCKYYWQVRFLKSCNQFYQAVNNADKNTTEIEFQFSLHLINLYSKITCM